MNSDQIDRCSKLSVLRSLMLHISLKWLDIQHTWLELSVVHLLSWALCMITMLNCYMYEHFWYMYECFYLPVKRNVHDHFCIFSTNYLYLEHLYHGLQVIVSEQNLNIWRCPITIEVMSFMMVLIGQCWITAVHLLTRDLQTTVSVFLQQTTAAANSCSRKLKKYHLQIQQVCNVCVCVCVSKHASACVCTVYMSVCKQCWLDP